MASVNDLRQQIDSAKDLESIVRVMKTLSAVSIRQYQQAARRLRAFQEVIDRNLHVVLMNGKIDIVNEAEPTRQQGLIVFGSDQGLCGRFNEVVVRRVEEWIEKFGQNEIPISAVGLRCAARLEAEGFRAHPVFSQPGSVSGIGHTAQSILLTLDQWRAEKGTEKVIVFFNAEAGEGGLDTFAETVLPLGRDELRKIAGREWPTRQLPTFDGATNTVFSALVRERLYTTLMRAGAESLAAEHATRLSAMQGAENNITEKIDELQDSYRRERQDQITNELMDIVSAYESVAQGGSSPG